MSLALGHFEAGKTEAEAAAVVEVFAMVGRSCGSVERAVRGESARRCASMLVAAALCFGQFAACERTHSDAERPPSATPSEVDAGAPDGGAADGAVAQPLDKAPADAGAHTAAGHTQPPKTPGDRDAGGPGVQASAPPSSDAGSDAGTTQSPDAAVTTPPACRPTAGGPYTLLEGEVLDVTVHCEASGVQASIGVSPLPRGATFDAKSGRLRFQPDLSQAASYHFELRAQTPNDSGALDVQVIERWDAPGNVKLADPATYLEEYGLPVFHLQTDPGLNDDTYTPATVVYRGHTYAAQAKGRGQVSAGYPKRSYTVKLSKTDKFDEPDAAGGFHQKRKLVLYAGFDDNSHLRQRLGFELWNQLDPRHIQVQSYSAVVFLDGEYHGMYTVLDHIDGYLMEDFGYDQHGNLYKARTHNANFRATADPGELSPTKSSLHDGYTKEEGDDSYADLDEMIDWVESSSDTAFAQQIDAVLTRYEYEDWWLWVTFIDATDSAGKNSYHYHDPLLVGSRWHMVPWDLNASFGQDWDTRRISAQANPPEGYYVEANGLFERLLKDPRLGAALRARYAQTLQHQYALSGIQKRLDQMAAEIEPSALRDEVRWQPVYRDFTFWKYREDFTNWQQEVTYVRRWIADRHAFLSGRY